MKKEVLYSFVGIMLLSGCATNKSQSVAEQTVVNKKLDIVSDFNEFAKNEKVYFAFDDGNLNASSEKVLIKYKDKVQSLNESSTAVVLNIEGYCDSRGSEKYNNDLGLKRANSVKDVVSKWLGKNVKVNVVSFGKDKYKVYTDDKEKNYQENRRVELVASR